MRYRGAEPQELQVRTLDKLRGGPLDACAKCRRELPEKGEGGHVPPKHFEI